MEISILDDILDSLKNTNQNLSDRYLKPYFDNAASIDEFKFDTRSYCVLLHAALEGFVEGVSGFIAKYSFYKFENDGEITIPLMFLLGSTGGYEKRLSVDDDSNITEHVVDYIYNYNSLGKKKWLDVISSNHGIKPKHLNKILQGIGIHFPSTHESYSSWVEFSNYRGEFAHYDVNHLSMDKSNKANKELSPEDASKKGEECITYASVILDEVKRNFSDNNYIKERISLCIKTKEEKEKKAALKEANDNDKKTKDKLNKEEKEKEKEANKQRNIERVQKLDLILDFINKNPEKYADLHAILFSSSR